MCIPSGGKIIGTYSRDAPEKGSQRYPRNTHVNDKKCVVVVLFKNDQKFEKRNTHYKIWRLLVVNSANGWNRVSAT